MPRLLVDADRRRALISVLVRWNAWISVICYVAGVACFMGLAFEPFIPHAKMSETALLHTMVQEGFTAGEMTMATGREFAANRRDADGEMPVDWLVKTMESRGLEAFTQTFNRTLPFPDENKRVIVNGTNVYGILRAPRAHRAEALVLSVPSSPGNANSQAVGLMLGLAEYLRRQIYWAKDIIFLVNDHNLIGMQAWLEGYHHTSTATTGTDHRSPIVGRGGSIEAALSLELGTEAVTGLDLVLEGLNGQLPNLDLVVLFDAFCQKMALPCSIQGERQRKDGSGYGQALRTMLLMVVKQASGRPWGNHGLFLRYGIDAASIKGVNDPRRHHNADATKVGRLVEGMCRKLNNLSARLHQGTSFYLVPSLSRFVSIAYYMPAFGLLAAVLLLRLLDLWVQLVSLPARVENSPQGIALSLLTTIVLSHLMGVALYTLPIHSRAVAALPISETEIIVLTAVVIYVVGLAIPYIQGGKRCTASDRGWRILKLVTVMYLTLLLGCVAFVNFSLGFALALMLVPLAAFVTPRAPRFPSALAAIVLSPAGVLVCGVLLTRELQEMPGGFPDGPRRLLLSTISQGILDNSLYGSLVYPLVTLTIYPCWLIFWNILFWR